jgi:hypothetical protein
MSPPPHFADDADAPFLAPPTAWTGGDWGPAALAAGGVLLVAGFPGILVIMVLAMNWNRLIAGPDTDLTAALGYAGYALGLVGAVAAVVSAGRGWVIANRQGRSVAWAAHGLLVGVLAVVVWGIALYSWSKCIDDVTRQQPMAAPPVLLNPPVRLAQ